MADEEAPRLGRPPTDNPAAPRPKARKGHQLSAAITAETYQALRDEAARSGRSVSQVTELWLEEARRGRATYQERMGGAAPAVVIEAMAMAAVYVREQIGDVTSDPRARAALLAAWREIAPKLLVLPFRDPSRSALIAADMAVKDTAEAVLDALPADAPLGRSVISETAAAAPSTPEGLSAYLSALDLAALCAPADLVEAAKAAAGHLASLESERLVTNVRGFEDGRDIARRVLAPSERE